ncbi:hypothetical protein RHSIM_Rhsim01G0283200 [Rhododendron simsii]|uniref:Uncharacterized protein n=1 Tax=Rhododendron simsii TaxID=118357 RepID=A0A834LWL4_RHOSS|nr:hypothetical protein RHSIM_Rhsim01G0283200 [Rhododendron simsii]
MNKPSTLQSLWIYVNEPLSLRRLVCLYAATETGCWLGHKAAEWEQKWKKTNGQNGTSGQKKENDVFTSSKKTNGQNGTSGQKKGNGTSGKKRANGNGTTGKKRENGTFGAAYGS